MMTMAARRTVAFQVIVNPVGGVGPMAVADSATGTEDAGTITGNVLDGASGGEDVGTGLTVTRYVAGTDIAASPANAPDPVQGAHGSLAIVAASGAFTYTLADSNNVLPEGGNNTDAFIYEISDSNGALSTATLTITITGVNDRPSVSNPGAQPVIREAGVDSNGDPVAAVLTVSGTFSITDPDVGDTHTYEVFQLVDYTPVTSQSAEPLDGPVWHDGGGSCWQLVLFNRDRSQDQQFLCEPECQRELQASGSRLAQQRVRRLHITFRLQGTNDAPVAVANPSVAVATAGEPYTADLNGLFTDAEGDTLIYSLGTGTCDGFAVSGTGLIGSDSGTVPADTAAGTVACTVTANDSNGGMASTSLQVTVNAAVVLAPMAVADTATGTEEDPTITGNVIAGDMSNADAGKDSGTGLTVTRYTLGNVIGLAPDAPAFVEGLYGRLVITAASGAFTYTVADSDSNNALAMGEVNTDTFAYEILGTDGTTDVATLTITINGVNDAPVPIDNPRVDAAAAGEPYALDLRALVH